jgi:transcriptional regulator with XRE-family HTH domain
MGTNLTSPLDSAPQTGAGVYANENLLADTREVLRCGNCQLRQFRPQSGHCRRCQTDLDAPPPPLIDLSVSTTGSDIEPGIETAEATGVPVPNVAGAIRAWRQRIGLSQRQLADRMQVPRTYVSKIENDKATPTISSLGRMATAMDTDISSLLASEATPMPMAQAELLRDPFLRALLEFVPALAPRQLQQLLAVSRQLAASGAA